MSDGFKRPFMSPLAAAVRSNLRRDKLKQAAEYDISQFCSIVNQDLPEHSFCHLQTQKKITGWSSISLALMQHIYGANNKKINPDPFPICPVTRVVEVEKDDPREALRHGGKKVLATQKLEKNQVIGIYEGLEIFDFEQEAGTNILNEMKLQFKTIDYKTLGGGDDEYIIKMEDFAKAKNVRIRSSSDGRPGVVWDPKRPNIVKLRGGLMVNGNYEHGYFKWTTEINDYRLNPFEDVGLSPAELKRKERENKMKANVKFAEVEILGWPVYLILVTSTILEGEELLVDYDLDNFWEPMVRTLRDYAIVKELTNRGTGLEPEDLLRILNCEDRQLPIYFREVSSRAGGRDLIPRHLQQHHVLVQPPPPPLDVDAEDLKIMLSSLIIDLCQVKHLDRRVAGLAYGKIKEAIELIRNEEYTDIYPAADEEEGDDEGEGDDEENQEELETGDNGAGSLGRQASLMASINAKNGGGRGSSGEIQQQQQQRLLKDKNSNTTKQGTSKPPLPFHQSKGKQPATSSSSSSTSKKGPSLMAAVGYDSEEPDLMEEVGEEGGGYVAPSLTSPKQRAGQPQQQRQGMKPFSNTKNNDNITDLTGVFDQDLFNIGGGGSNSNMLFTNAPSSFSTQLISAAAAASDTMALVKCTHTTAIVCPVAEDKLAVLTETVFYYLLRLQKLDKYWKYLFGVENYNDLQDIYCHISPVWKSNNARAVKLLQACHQQLQRSSSSSSFSYTISKKILSQLEKLAAGVYSFSDIGESSSRDLVQRKVFQSFYDFSEAFSDEAQLESTWSEEAKLCMDSFKDKFRNAISFCTNCAGVLFVDPQFPSSLGVTDPCVNRVWEDDQFCRYCMEKVKRRMNPSASKIKFKELYKRYKEELAALSQAAGKKRKNVDLQ